MKRVAGLVLATIIGGGLSGCAASVRNHGYAPDTELLAEISVGRDTRGSVQRKIGRPSTTGVFTNTGWYYVAATVEHYTYHEPEVTDRRIVSVQFGPNDVVTGVNVYGIEEGRIIDLQTRTTPNQGRQLTIIQQLLGNMGSLSAEQVLDQ